MKGWDAIKDGIATVAGGGQAKEAKEPVARNWRLLVDVEKCEDCNNCFLACKDEFVDNDFPGYSAPQPRHGHRWINVMRKERGQYPLVDVAYLPMPCMHCDDAPCVKAGKDGAVYKRDDGIVLIDPPKALGQKAIQASCPYGAVYWNEEQNTPQKCTLCAHLLDDGWKAPRCVQACPTGALTIIDADDSEIDRMMAAKQLQVLQPGHQTRPRVYYQNLYRYERCFIAGSVAVRVDEVEDCAVGVKVTLLGPDRKKIESAVTDAYGDFKFDGLVENSGGYHLEIAGDGYQAQTLELELTQSQNVGVVNLIKN